MTEHLKGRVLLLDAELQNRMRISECLVSAGYVVQTADDGLDAIGKLRGGLPDLIISALSMPGMSGLEFLGLVRKRFPQIPVIVTTGDASDEMPEEVAADAYYQKDRVGFELLLQIISNLTRTPPLRTAPAPVDNEPVQARWDKSGDYILDCPDCLREFTVPRVLHMGRNEQQSICLHCGKLVHFLVAETSG